MSIRTFISGSALTVLLLGISFFAGAQTEQPVPVDQTASDLTAAPAPPETTPAKSNDSHSEPVKISELKKDVILVLDNSGSMKKNDPQFLTNRAVTEFVTGLDETTRVAIEIFDQDVRLVIPLTTASLANREKILKSLDSVNYKGLFTDSPAAIERAIYELKNNAGEAASKFIIFMTDGIVDTGSAEKDVEKTKWLREDLAPDAADSNIRIFGIAFTEAADFQLIQTLAQKTGGEYYRVLKAEDLRTVFGQISNIMQHPPEPESAKPAEQAPPLVKQLPPRIIEIPAEPQKAIRQEERTRSIIIVISSVVLILALIAIIVLLLRRGRELRSVAEMPVVEAYLNDIHGVTNQASYKLGSKPAMLGRVAGKDTEHLDYIVIPETTIGRRHALIEYKDFAYWIVDQGSINGTFVNDVPISSEVRLKHGDRIRLHKTEFEFVMPEMNEAGLTVISKTVFAQQGLTPPDEATLLKDGGADAGGEVSLDFDLSFPHAGATEATDSDDEEATVVRESKEAPEEEPDYGTEDETLVPGGESGKEPVYEQDYDSEDETLLPGGLEDSAEDETLRPDSGDESLDPYLEELERGKNKKKD